MGLLVRLLAPIATVKRHEVAGALLLSLLVFLVLAAYYLMKTAREMLILTEGGAEVKSYSSAAQAVLLTLVVPAYAAVASRVGPARLVGIVTLFFAVQLALFVAAIGANMRVGIPYFLWVGIFNLVVISQFWAFASDLYTSEQGTRLFPLIGVGASLGAWLGSLRAGALVENSGPARLLLGACLILLICAAMVPVIARVVGRSRPRDQPVDDRPLDRSGAFGMIARDRYLLLLALLTFLLNVVNTTGEYLFGRYVVEQANALHGGAGADAVAAREQFVGEPYSRFFATVNLVGFLLQMFAVSRLFAWLGVGKSLFVHPLVAFAGYAVMLRAPSMQAMTVFKVADNSIDYSLGNTTKQALWLITSRDAKYKAKQAVDTFFHRAGDVAQAGLVYAGERLALTVPAFAAIAMALTGVWLGVAGLLAAERRRREGRASAARADCA